MTFDWTCFLCLELFQHRHTTHGARRLNRLPAPMVSMQSGGPNRVVRDPDALDDFQPGMSLIGREAQLTTLVKCLSPAVSGRRPLQVWIAGPPGSGKTLLARHALEQLKRPHEVHAAYVNCWRSKRQHGVVESIVRGLRLLGAEKIDTQFKLERLRQHIGGKTLIVVLDEVDRLSSTDREALLYDLMEIGCVGVVCISNSRSTYFELDPRVRSRLNPYLLTLDGFEPRALVTILEDRARRALNDGAWDTALLERIAHLSAGDARVALRTLRRGAQLAEMEAGARLLAAHVEKGWVEVVALEERYLLGKVTEHHRLIYDVVRRAGSVESINARTRYVEICARKGLMPVAPRTFTKYVTQLAQLNLITKTVPNKWGNVRVLQPSGRYSPHGPS